MKQNLGPDAIYRVINRVTQAYVYFHGFDPMYDFIYLIFFSQIILHVRIDQFVVINGHLRSGQVMRPFNKKL